LNTYALTKTNHAFDGRTIANLKLICVWQLLSAIPINISY